MRPHLLLFLGLGACAVPAPRADSPGGARPGALFEFHSDPWVNLHQRLVAEATADKYWHAEVATCACARTPEGAILPAWSSAVTGYRALLAGRSPVFDDPLVRTNLALALAGSSPLLPKAGLDPAVAGAIEGAFAPYLRGAWAADEARNRAWITAVEPLIAKWGAEVADELARRFDTAWPRYPIRVEVTQYAGFGGAYTTSPPILTTISSEDAGYAGPAALEMLFHEALHGLDGPLDHDLQMAFIAAGKRLPPRLDHALIFYTAGELVRRRLGPSYTPYAYKQGVYARGWQPFEALLRAHWQPWLDDQIDLPTALSRLAAASPGE